MKRLLISAALLVLGGGVARADRVHLKDGRVLEGVTREAEGGVELETRMGSMVIPHADILRVEKLETAKQEYERRHAELNPDDLTAAVDLAAFCVEHDELTQAARALALRVVEAEEAGADEAETQLRKKAKANAADLLRGELDFHLVDGRWSPPEEYYPERGFVKVRGRWLSPEEVGRRQAAKDRRAADKDATEAERSSRRSSRGERNAQKAYERAEETLAEAKARVEHYEGEVERVGELLKAAQNRFESRERDLADSALVWQAARDRHVLLPDGHICHCDVRLHEQAHYRLKKARDDAEEEVQRHTSAEREAHRQLSKARSKLGKAELALSRAERDLVEASEAAEEGRDRAEDAREDAESLGQDR